MKLITLIALSIGLSTPALAHGGAHMHPHGFEPVVAGLAVLTVALLAFAFRR